MSENEFESHGVQVRPSPDFPAGQSAHAVFVVIVQGEETYSPAEQPLHRVQPGAEAPLNVAAGVQLEHDVAPPVE